MDDYIIPIDIVNGFYTSMRLYITRRMGTPLPTSFGTGATSNSIRTLDLQVLKNSLRAFLRYSGRWLTHYLPAVLVLL
jgi:hypothetical protein